MKKILSIFIIILIAFNAYSQSVNQHQYLKTANNQTTFQKVYTITQLSSYQIEKLIICSYFKDIEDIEISDNAFRGKIKNIFIDPILYGYKLHRVAIYINSPFNADVLITWKNGKYKVIVYNMYFDPSKKLNKALFGNEHITCDWIYNDTYIANKHEVISLGFVIEKYLSELFILDTKEW